MAPSYRDTLTPATPIEEMYTVYLESFPALMALATGGIYPYTSLSYQGITRETTPEAYDADGYLLPIIVVKTRAPLPDNRIFDQRERLTATNQVLELWVYEDIGYVNITQILDFVFNALHCHKFPDYYPMQWAYTSPSLKDDGSLKGCSCIRIDFATKRIRRAVPV